MTTENQLSALRALEDLEAATYSEWKNAEHGVPEGSFGRVVRALVEQNVVTEVQGLYRPAASAADTDTAASATDTDTTDTDANNEAAKRIAERKERLAAQSGTMVFDVTTGEMIPHSESLRRKGYPVDAE